MIIELNLNKDFPYQTEVVNCGGNTIYMLIPDKFYVKLEFFCAVAQCSLKAKNQAFATC